MPVEEKSAVPNDPPREAKADNTDSRSLQLGASRRGLANPGGNTGRKPMFRADQPAGSHRGA
jgi:hypothetical protein